MSLDKKESDKIYSLLDRVKDPEIGVSIIKLKMVSAVEMDGKVLRIKIKLTVPGCPLSATIEKDVKEILRLEGYDNVELEFGYMTKEELDTVKKSIQGNNQKLPPPIERYDKKQIKNIIAVYSAKGGVGKSSVVAMLAVAATKLGYKTGILDCDISGPSIQTIFHEKYRAILDKNDKLAPLLHNKIKMISVEMLTDAEALIWRGPLVSSAIKQMYSDTDWGDLDILFLDLPPGTSDGPLTVFQAIPVDKILLVTTPQNLSQVVGRKTVLMSEILKVPILGIIENMSYMRCEHCGEKTNMPGASEKPLKKFPILSKLEFKKEISIDLEQGIDPDTFNELNGAINAAVYKD